MKSQLVAGLEGMLQQRHRFDYILIETSGAKCFDVAMVSCALLMITNACPCSDVDKRTMKHCQVCAGLANPGPVATALWTDTELEAGVTLDGIVTVSSWSVSSLVRSTSSVNYLVHFLHFPQSAHCCASPALSFHVISNTDMPLNIQVADARHLPRQLAAAPTAAADATNSSSSANEAQQQIAYSDVVLLNKVAALKS